MAQDNVSIQLAAAVDTVKQIAFGVICVRAALVGLVLSASAAWPQALEAEASELVRSNAREQSRASPMFPPLNQHDQFAVAMADVMTAGQPDGSTDNSADFAKLNNYCSLATGAQNNSIVVNLAPLHYKVHDVTFNCGIQFKGVRGASTIPPTSPVAPTSGTILDYSGATSFLFKWTPSGWPLVIASDRVNGALVQDASIYSTNQSASIAALEFYGVTNPTVKRVDFVGENGGLIDYWGGYGGLFEDIMAPWVNGTGILLRGDLSGKQLDGSACSSSSIGNCSSRLDVPLLNHINMNATVSGVCVEIRGIVDTVEQQHTSCENGVTAVKIDCPSVIGTASGCPEFYRGLDVQAEFQTSYSFDLSDFTDFRCAQCYAVGDPSSPPSSTIYARSTNYAPGSGNGGGLWWTDGTIYNAKFSCAKVAVSDAHFTGGFIQYCNLRNHGSAGVEYENVPYIQNETIEGVTFCSFNGAPSTADSMAGVLVNGTANQSIQIGPTNNFQNCANGSVVNGSFIGQAFNTQTLTGAISSGVATNIASETIPAGHYICYAMTYTHPAASTVQTLLKIGLSITSASLSSQIPTAQISSTQAAGDSLGLTSGPYFINPTGSRTLYAVAFIRYDTSTLTIDGEISCTRLY